VAEVSLPAALRKGHGLQGGEVAVVEVSGDRLKLRFLRASPAGRASATLTAPEEAALARGGVAAVSTAERHAVDARTAAAYDRLRATSLTVEEAARRLGVNGSRIRQRLAERSLYGLKEGAAWRLPSFQFRAQGLVPGVDVVVRRLPADISALAVARWFQSPNPDLCTRDEEERPLTPLQWLAEGNPPQPAAALAAAL
jgi:hypothetical protein